MQNVYFPTFRAPKYNNNYNSIAESPFNMHTFLANVQNQMENFVSIFCKTMQMEIRLFILNHIHRKKRTRSILAHTLICFSARILTF